MSVKYLVAVRELDFASRLLWRRGRIVRDGVGLAYDLAGDGRALIFLSGGPGDGPGYLLPLAEAVVLPGWRLVLCHQRGTGRSSVPLGTALSVEQAVGDVAALAGHLGAEKVVLIGHSYGASLALLTAAAHPGLVEGAVLVAPGPLDAALAARGEDAIRAQLDEGELAALDAAEQRRDEAAANGNWPAMHAAVLQVMRLRVACYVRSPGARDRWRWEITEEFDHDPYTHQSLSNSLGTVDVRAAARSVRCPVQVIRGSDDFCPSENVEALRESVPRCTVTTIEKSAHLPWLDQPTAVAAAVQTYLRSV